MTAKNRLDWAQTQKLHEYLKSLGDHLVKAPAEAIAADAARELGFPVTTANVQNLRRKMNVKPIRSPKPAGLKLTAEQHVAATNLIRDILSYATSTQELLYATRDAARGMLDTLNGTQTQSKTKEPT